VTSTHHVNWGTSHTLLYLAVELVAAANKASCSGFSWSTCKQVKSHICMSHVTHMNVPGLGAGSSSEEAFILWLLIQHIARLCAVFGFTAREEVKARLAVRRCADHGIYLKGLCAMHTLASRSLHISRPRHPSPLSRSSCCRCTLLSATHRLAALRIYTARHAQLWLFAVRHTHRTRPSSCALQGVANVQTAKSLEKLQRVAVQVKRGTASLPHVALPHCLTGTASRAQGLHLHSDSLQFL